MLPGWPSSSAAPTSTRAVARARIADAIAVLDGLGEQHSEPLVPAELRQGRRRAGPRARADQRRRVRRRRHRRPAVGRAVARGPQAAAAHHRGVRRACDAIGRALGAAEGRRDAARCARTPRRWSRCGCARTGWTRAGPTPACAALLGNPRLAGPVRRVEADRHAAFRPWLAPGRTGWPSCSPRRRPAAAGDPDEWLGQRRQDRRRRPGARAVAIGTGPDRRRARSTGVPGRRPAARRVAPADHLHPRQPGAGRGAGGEPAAAGGQLLPARAWCSCTSGTSASSPGRCPGSTR